jgi:hypothetical protein
MKLKRGNFLIFYLISIQIVLLITAALKLFTACLSDTKLAEADDLLWMFSTRQVLMLAGLVEISVVLLLSKWRTQNKSLELILWLGTVFLIYRLFRWMEGGFNSYHCNCFGGFILRAESKISLGILAWMLIGSLVLLILQNCRPTKEGFPVVPNT